MQNKKFLQPIILVYHLSYYQMHLDDVPPLSQKRIMEKKLGYIYRRNTLSPIKLERFKSCTLINYFTKNNKIYFYQF